jgi:hypothetical protein
MNICEDRHTPKYVVRYKGARGSNYIPTWQVCEMCFNKECFGNKEDILETLVLQ